MDVVDQILQLIAEEERKGQKPPVTSAKIDLGKFGAKGNLPSPKPLSLLSPPVRPAGPSTVDISSPPVAVPKLSVEREAYTRPLGEDVLGDVTDFFGGAVGFSDPLGMESSTAGMAGMAATMIPTAGVAGMKGLYSRLGKFLGEKMPARMKAESVMSLAGKSGASREELEATRLREFLEGRRGTQVTQEEIQEQIARNYPQVQTKVLGEPHASNYEDVETLAHKLLTDAGFDPDAVAPGIYTEYINHAYKQLDRPRPSSPTKFSTHTLPGGENYRETLLQLRPNARAKSATPGPGMPPEEQFDFAPKTGTDLFRAGHFDEPNVLVHVRHKDRLTPDGKRVRAIEEIQSDWHQKGKKHGYADPQRYEVFDPKDGKPIQVFDSEEAAAAFVTKFEQENPGSFLDYSTPEISASSGAVPDAPFKDTWPDLALKQQFLDASEKGLDGVSWTPAAVQNQRYKDHLIKQIGEVHLSGTNFKAYSPDGVEVISRTGVTPDQLEELIGKSAAEQLLAQPKQGTLQSLRGLDMEVGGEGMVEFYDKLLPARAEKLLKPFGGRVERGEVVTGETPDPYFITWRDEMPQEMGGMPPPQGVHQRRGFTGEDESDAVLSFLPGATQGDAFDYRNMMGKQLPPQTAEQWMARLTPEMRKLILEKGFPALAMLMALQGQDKNNLPEFEP